MDLLFHNVFSSLQQPVVEIIPPRKAGTACLFRAGELVGYQHTGRGGNRLAVPVFRTTTVLPRAASTSKAFGSNLKVKDQRRHNAKAQTRKEQPGGFRPRAGLHGNELRLWPGRGQAGDDRVDPHGGRTRRHLLRYRGSVRPVHERRAGRRGPGSVPRPRGDRYQVRLQARSEHRQTGRTGQPPRAHPGKSPRPRSSGSGPTSSICSISTASTRTCRSKTWPER